MPFTLIARRIGKNIYIYYRYRRDDGTRSSLLSTGVKAKTDSDRDIAAARRKANAVCMELMKDGALAASSSVRLSGYCSKFFTPECRYVRWKTSKGSRRDAGLTASSIASYRKVLENQILPYLGGVQMSRLSTAMMKAWVMRLKRKYSNKTINNAIGVMHIVVNQAKEDGVIAADPLAGVGVFKVDKPDTELFTADELRRLFSPGNWDGEAARLAALLSCCTGMRIGEIIALEGGDLHADYIDVSRNYDASFGYGNVKTHEARKIPLCGELRATLPGGGGILFTGEDKSKPIPAGNIRRKLRRAAERVGIDMAARRLSFHSFRHFFNTYLEKEDVSPAKIRAVMGHKDGSMTGVYTNWDANEFPEVYEAQRKLLKGVIDGNDQIH